MTQQNAQLAARLSLENDITGFQYRKKYFTPNAGAAAAGESKFIIKFPLKTLFSYLDHNVDQ